MFQVLIYPKRIELGICCYCAQIGSTIRFDTEMDIKTKQS